MSHSHNHEHNNANNFGRSFLIAAILNTLFIIAEIFYGIHANSVALLADAGHNFSDVIGLLLAWAAWWLSKRKPTKRYTYGLRSTSIMAALFNALFLFIAVGGIIWEALHRFGTQPQVAGNIVMWVAGLGIVINAFTAWLFHKGQHDLNVKAAFTHLAADAVVSAGVVIAGFIINYTGWQWFDPAVSIAISIIIIWGTWGLLRDSVNLTLHAVPNNIDITKVKNYLEQLPGVKAMHDLHIWGMSTTEVALSVHLLTPDQHPGDEFLNQIATTLHDEHHIDHATIQIEIGNTNHQCHLADEAKV